MDEIFLKILQPPNLTELVCKTLKQHMLDGTLLEGARLTEEVLARQFGISKSPVREALNRLDAEGLISIQSRRGAHVRRFSLEETRDLFDVRVLLECYSVRHAQLTQAVLGELRDSVEQLSLSLEQGDKITHVEEDLRFHSLIAASAGNGEFFRIFESVQNRTILSRAKTYHLAPSNAPVWHHKILRALELDDRDAAETAMREHIQFLRNELVAFMHEFGAGKMPEHQTVPAVGSQG